MITIITRIEELPRGVYVSHELDATPSATNTPEERAAAIDLMRRLHADAQERLAAGEIMREVLNDPDHQISGRDVGHTRRF